MELFRLSGQILVDAANAISNLRSFESRIEKAGEKIKNMGTSVTNLGKSMTLGLSVPILAGFGASIKAASDLNETLSKTDVVFGENSQTIKKWSNTTLKSFGLAKDTALENAAVYADMGSSMGLNATQVKNVSQNMVELTGDMASFKNMKPDEIHTALTGVFTGETEALKRLGVVMLESNLIQFAKTEGIKKDWKEMTQAEKVMLRYKYVMDVTKNSQGDFQRTQASFANQLRILTEGFKESAAKIGMIFLPMATKVITIVRKLFERFNDLPEPIRKIGVIVALLVAGIGPLVLVLGTVITGIGAFVAAIGTIGLPVMAVIAGIGILIGYLTTVTGVIVALAVKTGVFGKAIDYLKWLFFGIKEALTGDMMQAFVTFVDVLGMNQKKAAQFTLKLIALKDIFLKLKTLAFNVGKLIKSIFSGEKQEIINLLIKKFNYSKKEATLFYLKIDIARKKVVEYANKIKDKAITALTLLVDKLKVAGKWIIDHRKQIAQAIEIVITFAYQTIITAKKIYDAAKWVVKFAIKVNDKIKDVVKKFRELPGKILDALSSLGSKLYNSGKNAMKQFIAGLTSKFNELKNKVASAANIVGDFLGFSSPTKKGAGKDSDKWSPNLMKMFAKGISANKFLAMREMEKMMKEFRDIGTVENNLYGDNKIEMPAYKSKSVPNITVNLNNANIYDKRGVAEIMKQVKGELQTYMNYKYS